MILRIEDLEAMMFGFNSAGFCETCQEVDEHAGCEPDAEGYTCPNCGEKTLHGLEQALMMGLIEAA
jgi:hypothetical protein